MSRLRMDVESKVAVPAAATGIGKVLLAFADAGTRRRRLRRPLVRRTPNTITDPEAPAAAATLSARLGHPAPTGPAGVRRPDEREEVS